VAVGRRADGCCTAPRSKASQRLHHKCGRASQGAYALRCSFGPETNTATGGGHPPPTWSGTRGVVAVVSRASMSRLARAAARLKASKHKVAVAESSAGGLIAASLLAQPGASAFFAGAVTCYTKPAKRVFLGLDADKTKPTATAPHAVELATAVRNALQADWAIGETGVRAQRRQPAQRAHTPRTCADAAAVGVSVAPRWRSCGRSRGRRRTAEASRLVCAHSRSSGQAGACTSACCIPTTL
jgi:PncC family amidohydrolase